MHLEIFVPFYGDPEMLRETVRSVLRQDVGDWELTVVDDGYPDAAVGRYFAGVGDPRVHYLRNDTQLGANGNFRRCLELAGQELVMLLGADDLLHPNYVSTVLAAHRAFPDAVIIAPGVLIIDHNGDPTWTFLDWIKTALLRPRVGKSRLLAGEEVAAGLLRGNWLYFPSLTFSRRPMASVGFRPDLDVVQDLALVIDLVARGHSMVLESTVCFSYRRHSASDSSWRALEGTRFVEQWRYFMDAAAQMDTLGWRRAARVARRHWVSRAHALTLLPRSLRAGHRAGARTLVRHVIGAQSTVGS